LKTVVVSEWEKAHWMCQVGAEKTCVVAVDVSKELVDIGTEMFPLSRDEPGGCPFIGQVVSGIEAT
jgi:hypothetical protein